MDATGAVPLTTVRRAALLVAEPVALVTTQVKSESVSVSDVLGVVYVAEFAPVMLTLFFFH